MKAWQLIEKPENWCKGVVARNISGEPVPANSNAAFSFCEAGKF